MLESRWDGRVSGSLLHAAASFRPNAGNNHLGLGHPFTRVSGVFQKGWAIPVPYIRCVAHGKGAGVGHHNRTTLLSLPQGTAPLWSSRRLIMRPVLQPSSEPLVELDKVCV